MLIHHQQFPDASPLYHSPGTNGAILQLKGLVVYYLNKANDITQSVGGDACLLGSCFAIASNASSNTPIRQHISATCCLESCTSNV